MFPLLIFVRQQHGNAYLHYRPAPRGAFPKPFTQRLISSDSLLSPSSSNWEQIEAEGEHYPAVSSSDSQQKKKTSVPVYSHAIGPWTAPLSSLLSLLSVFTEQEHLQLFLSPYKEAGCKKISFFSACLYCEKQKRDNAVKADSFILATL